MGKPTEHEEDLSRLPPGEPSPWRYVCEPLDGTVTDEDLHPFVWGDRCVSFYPWYDRACRHKVAGATYRWSAGLAVESGGGRWETVSARCVYRRGRWCMRWLCRPAPAETAKGKAVYTRDDLKEYPVWRHVETDSLYHVLGLARCSTNGPGEGKENAVIYFSLSYQSLRYREVGEFLDGRFQPEPPQKA